MQKKPRKIFHKIILIIGFLFSLVYVAACLTPYINPSYSWLLTILAYSFPFLLAGMLLLIISCLFFKRKFSLLFFIILLLGYKNISTVFGFHPFQKFTAEKKGTFRLLSWNVNGFLDNQIKYDFAQSPRRQMFSFIQQTNADVLCLQDFINYVGKDYLNNVNYITDSLGYKYTYNPVDFTYHESKVDEQYGTIIFSKYPIVNANRIQLAKESPTEFLSHADVLIDKKIIRFYNTHFRSLGIHRSMANPEEINILNRDSSLILHKSTLKTLKKFDRIHTEEATLIKKYLNATQAPFVFCADLNSIPTSFTYHQLKNNLQDAFLQNGFGLGTTYDSLSPTLRIDVVFMNKLLKPVQQQTPHLHLSDHFPNVVDIKIP